MQQVALDHLVKPVKQAQQEALDQQAALGQPVALARLAQPDRLEQVGQAVALDTPVKQEIVVIRVM